METSRTNVPSIADNATRFASSAISESAQRRKAQIRKLVKELKVMGRAEITPTYRVPALVRAPGDQVEVAGRCVNRIGLFKALHQGVPST
jgi:hypothetical protein